jgi:hypothetical protein
MGTRKQATILEANHAAPQDESRDIGRSLLETSKQQVEALRKLALTLEAEDADDTTEMVQELALVEQQHETLRAGLVELRRLVVPTVSGRRAREVILQALDEIGAPADSTFVRDYITVRFSVDVDPRQFSSLVRDEFLAWARHPTAERRYVTRALDARGFGRERWLATTAWPLEQRIMTRAGEARVEQLKIVTIAKLRRKWLDRHSPVRVVPVPTPFDQLLGAYLETVTSDAAVPRRGKAAPAPLELRVRRTTRGATKVSEGEVKERKAAAKLIAAFSPVQQLWGQDWTRTAAFNKVREQMREQGLHGRPSE